MHKTRNALAEVNAAVGKLRIRPARADEAEIADRPQPAVEGLLGL